MALNTTRNVARENATRVPHTYEVGQQVWVRLAPSDRKWKLNAPFEGPFPILNVYPTGTLKIQRGAYEETIHIRRVKPFLASDDVQETEPHQDVAVCGGECHSPGGIP